MQSKIRILSVINLLALLVHIFFSYATQFKLVNTKDVGQISDQYVSLFTPAGFTFAIWGFIYVSLLGFCMFHIFLAFSRVPAYQSNQDISRIGGLFMFNNLAAAAWLLAWTHNRIGFSLGLIWFQLITLIAIHSLINIHNPRRQSASKVFTQFPLSIYLGWISIATIANTAVYLTSANWDGFGYSAIIWTRIMIGAAVLITLLVVLLWYNVFFGLVVIWALYGIIRKLQMTNAITYADIIQTAWISIAIVSIVCIIQFIKNLGMKKIQQRFPEAIPVK
ncbi:MAG: hypothetical protein QM764_06030 [Chitinophagaceae bacterium]